MPTQPRRPRLIGWKEFIDFPEWGFCHVKAKIDTGARTSALDVAAYELGPATGDGLVAELRLALHRRHPERFSTVRVPVLGMVMVRNSNGMEEQRPLIETRLRLGNVTKSIKLTVTNRAEMRFAVILGRTALAGDFVVDVSQKYLQRR